MTQIHDIDLHYRGVPNAIACYLIIDDGEYALIETGPSTTLEYAVAGLEKHGLTPADISKVLVTHIHFDHAGAVGWWAKQGAHIYVHHVGARHLIDPSRLIRSATRIYKDRMDELWGDILPVPAAQLAELHDGDAIPLGTTEIIAHDTPGHANHHMTFQIGGAAFTGDVGGVKLAAYPFIDLPAPPPEFHIEKWDRSLDKLLALDLDALYPTHYGRVDDPAGHLNAVRAIVHEGADLVKAQMDAGKQRDEIVNTYLDYRHGRAMAVGLSEDVYRYYTTANPPIMSVDGMIRYWKKKEDAA